jgi:hypothetical protein
MEKTPAQMQNFNLD